MRKNNTVIENKKKVKNCIVLSSVLSRSNQVTVQSVVVLLYIYIYIESSICV